MAIRRERNRLWKLEDEDLDPSYSWLDYLLAEKARGVQLLVTNFQENDMDMWFVYLMIGIVCVCNILHWHEIFGHFRGDDEEEEK